MNKLFLIPSSIGEAEIADVLPANFTSIINGINTFIVEEVRTARRFLRKAGYLKNFDEVNFHILNEHTDIKDTESYLSNIASESIGLLSEAGVPCVADPGSQIVALAHRKDIPVIPLVGPSSILLALMASGFNGQYFCFNGYLPVDKQAREKKIKQLESLVIKENQTQIFIETPYRNNHLIESICQVCSDNTLLCVASNLTQSDAFILSKPVKYWKTNKPDLHKKNTVFLIGKQS